MVALWLLFIAAGDAAPALREPRIVHSEKSPYATVFVVDEGHMRSLFFDSIDGDLQSIIDLKDPRAVPMDYLRVATAGLAFTKGRERALMIGLGGGAFATVLRRHVPKMRVDAVEIDPVVVSVAREYFGVTKDVNITVDDGAHFIATSADAYDVILIDAYSGDGIPEHLTTRAFFETVRARLTPAGVAVANIAIHKEGEEAPLIKTIASVFKGCTMLKGKEKGNIVVVAQQHDAPMRHEIRRSFADLTVELDLPFYVPKAVSETTRCP
jgi:spermidine synthase